MGAEMLQPICLQAGVLYPDKSSAVEAGWAKANSNSKTFSLFFFFFNMNSENKVLEALVVLQQLLTLLKNQTTRHKPVDQDGSLRVKTTFLHCTLLQES